MSRLTKYEKETIILTSEMTLIVFIPSTRH